MYQRILARTCSFRHFSFPGEEVVLTANTPGNFSRDVTSYFFLFKKHQYPEGPSCSKGR